MTGADVFEVLDGGLLTTIQDAGRPGLAGMGLGPGGAADPWSLAAANAVAGNAAGGAPGAAALEISLAGPVLRALRHVTVAVTGADLGAVTSGGQRIPAGQSRTLAMGDVLRLDGPDTAAPGNRAWRPRMRTYLAIPGGFDVPMVLGSRSTALGAGFGGLDGRAVRAGDILRCTDASALTGAPHRWPAAPLALPSLAASGTATLRAVPGPWAADSGNVLASLTAQVWTVGSASDRVGLRLDGDALPGVFPADLASHGLVTGAIQVPPGGRPIVLLPDRQPTGGYAVVAVVITADRPVLGQLAPGDQVAFRLVTPGEARTALRESRDLFQRALQHLDEDRRWDALADHAGG